MGVFKGEGLDGEGGKLTKQIGNLTILSPIERA